MTVNKVTNAEVKVSDVDKLIISPAPDGGTFLQYVSVVDRQWRLDPWQVRLPKEFSIVREAERVAEKEPVVGVDSLNPWYPYATEDEYWLHYETGVDIEIVGEGDST